MRLPATFDDRRLLEDEPFCTEFLVCASIQGRQGAEQRQRRLSVVATQSLKEVPDSAGISAADKWIKLAFTRFGADGPKCELAVNDELLRVFVTFYWKLYSDRESAELFLQHERKKRGYSSFFYMGSAPTHPIKSRGLPEASADRSLFKKTKVLSQRVAVGIKRDLLQDKKPPSKLPLATVVKIPKVSRRSTRGRAGNSHKTSLPNQPHGKWVALTSTDSTFEPTGAMIGIETFKHLDDLGQAACPPLQSQSQVPLKISSCSHFPGLLYPVPEEELFTPTLSDANHVLYQDNTTRPDNVQMTSSLNSTLQVGNVNPMKFEEPPPDVYPCKPPLKELPPIWAQSRQEVCESFEWFRSYQGGVYFIRDVVKGYLLSAFSSCRDLFEHEGRLIISHGGGKAESIHSRKGQPLVQLADDQLAQDKSVRALLTTYRLQRPLVLLIDDKYTLFPYDLSTKDVTYAVLGLYTITHVWAECQPARNERGYVIRYKFAFQWCEGQGEPWWIPKKQESTAYSQMRASPEFLDPPSVQYRRKVESSQLANLGPSGMADIYLACTHCHESTPHVYKYGWACLNASCQRFWILSDGSRLPFQLEYNKWFLQLLPPFILPPEMQDIRPPLPVDPNLATNGITTTHSFTRGWHCRSCGRLSCRYKWQHWECMWCKAKFEISGKIRVPKEFWAQKTPESFQDHLIAKSSGIIQQPSKQFFHGHGRGQTQTFILPEGRGMIHHIQPGPPSGNGEADVIFADYQEQASTGELAFRRWPLRSHKCRGPLLTNYFSQNSGEPYQYVGGTANTVPFDRAPSAVVKALKLIQERVSRALNVPSSFNEVLSCAYMERQKMAFHSDSEVGLGPLVAGLSLGSPALMHFRLRAKHNTSKDCKSVAITFVLRHGDILVMDGARVQEFYEHTVVPTNFRIAATARSIGSVHPRPT